MQEPFHESRVSQRCRPLPGSPWLCPTRTVSKTDSPQPDSCHMGRLVYAPPTVRWNNMGENCQNMKFKGDVSEMTW